MHKGTISSKRFRNYGHGGIVMRQRGKAVLRKQVEEERTKINARARRKGNSYF